jgi:hypothetical protein
MLGVPRESEKDISEMQVPVTTMKASCETPINLPRRTDRSHGVARKPVRPRIQACSPGHRAAGAFRENGMFGTINVESVGGHLLIQHYRAANSEPHHVTMHSRSTRVYVMHLALATIEVIWTLQIERKDGNSALFRCTVETRMPVLLAFFATLGLLPLFLRWHVQGETPLFAKDIARKIGGAKLATEEAFLVAAKRMGNLDALSREFAREHSDRLWKQLVAYPSEAGEPQAGVRTDAIVAFCLAATAAVAIKLSALFWNSVGRGSRFLCPQSESLRPPCIRRHLIGAPQEIRTPAPQIRSLVLFPAELWAHPALRGYQRQPSAGATCFRIASITCAL